MTIGTPVWNSIRAQFTYAENNLLNLALTSLSVCPPSVTLEEGSLSAPLREKLIAAVNDCELTLKPGPLELVAELRGMKCRCGEGKESGKTFCTSCYWSLPRDVQRNLYKKINQGYAEAYQEAVKILSGSTR